MECNNEVELVQSKSDQRYTFIGKDNKVETEDLEVKLSDKLLKKTFLLGNIKDLKLQIKLVEEKLQKNNK